MSTSVKVNGDISQCIGKRIMIISVSASERETDNISEYIGKGYDYISDYIDKGKL